MASRQHPEFDRLVAAVSRELGSRNVPHLLIGGQAVLLHGAPRLTQDIDVSLSVGPEEIAVVEDACTAIGLEPLVANPADFARETFVLPVRSGSSGVRVDFIFSNTEFERLAVDRAVHVTLSGETVPFASPEDLILFKLFAGRARDIDDARSVVGRQGAGLDWSYIERWAGAFAEIPGREDLPQRVAELRDDAD